MEASFLGFSRGKRVCLGQHIAMLQLKKVIPTLALKFNISLADEKQVLDADYTPAVIAAKPLYMKLSQKNSL
jgi:cytochrome P450